MRLKPALRVASALIGFVAGAIVAAFGPREILLAIGLALAGFGFWQVSPTAAFILVGAALTAVAIFGTR